MLNKFYTKEEVQAAAGEALNKLLVANKKYPVLLLLSGGSSFAMLDYVGNDGLTDNLTITMLDERFSEDPEINNFSKLQKLDFYKRALEKDANFIGTIPRPGELLDDMKIRFELALKNWIKAHPKGKIFGVFGMGPDGHTAGIFPYSETPAFFQQAFENQHLVMGYLAKGKHQHEQRITTTFAFFKLVDEAIVYVCGSKKRKTFEKFIEGTGQPHQLPALGIYETKNQQIFTDLS